MRALRLSKGNARLTREFVERLRGAIETEISRRALALTEESLRQVRPSGRRPATVAAVVLSTDEAEPSPSIARRADADGEDRKPPRSSRRRPPVSVGAMMPRPLDAEQERRSADLARLRAILNPMAAPPELITTPVPVAPPERSDADEGSLQALEDRIREALPALSGLSQRRYTAQIAAWVGRVRLYQQDHEPERARLASRLFMDKLRNLAWSMEAGTIEGLDMSWSTRHWRRYIDDNELIAATPDPVPESERRDAGDDLNVWSTP